MRAITCNQNHQIYTKAEGVNKMKKAITIIIVVISVFLAATISALAIEREGYVLNIASGCCPLKEIEGVAVLQFDSEYKVIIKNTTYRRVSARVFIDGSLVSAFGDFVIDSGKSLDLERFVTDSLNTGKRFKFVALEHPDVDDPVRSENGIIRVEIRKEVKNDGQIQWYQEYRGVPWDELYESGSFIPTVDNLVGISTGNHSDSDGVVFDSGVFSSTTVLTSASSAEIGATVAGSESNQIFHTVEYEFEDEFTELKLQLKGL